MARLSILVFSTALIAAPLAVLPFTATQAISQQMSDSGTMERANAEMRDVLMKLDQLGPKPLGSVEAEEARQQPTPADAVAALLKDQGKDAEQMKQASGVTTQDVTYPDGSGAQMAARVYKPAGGTAGMPVILYIHGGGWVIADLDTYDASPRALAKKANAIVVSVHYRQAPENKFPAAHDDTIAAYKWVLSNAQSWGGDASKIAVVGESAGGNMAINVAIAARDQQLQPPIHIVAVYPVAGTNLDTPSYQKNENAKPLNKAGMRWFFENYARNEADFGDPRLDLVKSAKLQGLPPTTIITAEIDPLMSEGQSLGEKLKAAGVATMMQNFEGVTHEFFGMDAVVKEAVPAQDFAAQQLTKSFGSTQGTASSSTTPPQTAPAPEGTANAPASSEEPGSTTGSINEAIPAPDTAPAPVPTAP